MYDGFVKVDLGPAISVPVARPRILGMANFSKWLGKLHNLAKVTDFFSSLGLPAPDVTATFVSSFEFVCGILLALGLLSRIAALGLVIDMFTAYWTADRERCSPSFPIPTTFRMPLLYFLFRRPC